MAEKPSFPLVEAILLTPEEAEEGRIGVCTNTTAPGQVYNEVESEVRPNTSVYGSLVVCRDGVERMILNSLVHPTLDTIVLFSNESSSFRPSSNLLLALQNGIKTSQGNKIIRGIGPSAHFPNIKGSIFDNFRDTITVLPAFMSESRGTRDIISSYLASIKDKVEPGAYEIVSEINQRDRIYYDSLNLLLRRLGGPTAREKIVANLDPKDFQQLQPPVIEVEPQVEKPEVSFKVSSGRNAVRVDLQVAERQFFIEESDDFLLGYSLMKELGENHYILDPLQQLLLGAEVGRVSTFIHNDLFEEPLVQENPILAEERVLSQPNTHLKPDEKYYYIVGIKDSQISVKCMAHDVCDEVFELRAPDSLSMVKKLAELNRFDDYEMTFLHRFDIGAQVARAGIALKHGYDFMQDFSDVFRVNKDTLPFAIVEGDNFLSVHKGLLRKIYTAGLTAEHGDRQKGLTRTIAALAVFKLSPQALEVMPNLYRQGQETTTQLREAYEQQLLRFDHDGSYSYGERTRSFFGHDQLPAAIERLKADPNKAFIVQRFDPITDMEFGIDPETGKTLSSHDPCLTHDIYFIKDGVLYPFHISRAHNAVNAYPENIFGLHDAYDVWISRELGIPLGDMFVFSSRANILLLTEEQRTKKILAEPSKPIENISSHPAGPYKIGEHVAPTPEKGLTYLSEPVKEISKRPHHPFLGKIENIHGVDTLERAIRYLEQKGASHNNPVLSTFRAGEDDPQAEHLVFFQANVMGGKLYASAVFANRLPMHRQEDINLANYLATQYAQRLKVELGELVYFNIGA